MALLKPRRAAVDHPAVTLQGLIDVRVTFHHEWNRAIRQIDANEVPRTIKIPKCPGRASNAVTA